MWKCSLTSGKAVGPLSWPDFSSSSSALRQSTSQHSCLKPLLSLPQKLLILWLHAIPLQFLVVPVLVAPFRDVFRLKFTCFLATFGFFLLHPLSICGFFSFICFLRRSGTNDDLLSESFTMYHVLWFNLSGKRFLLLLET